MHRELSEGAAGCSEDEVISSLDVAERFLFHIAQVPGLERKLHVISLMEFFPQLAAVARNNIRTLELAAAQVR